MHSWVTLGTFFKSFFLPFFLFFFLSFLLSFFLSFFLPFLFFFKPEPLLFTRMQSLSGFWPIKPCLEPTNLCHIWLVSHSVCPPHFPPVYEIWTLLQTVTVPPVQMALEEVCCSRPMRNMLYFAFKMYLISVRGSWNTVVNNRDWNTL